MRIRTVLLTGLTGLLFSAPAQAGHHLWKVSEAFSNASGQIQFVELFCTAANEAGLGAFTVTSTTHTLNFVTNLPSTATANTWALCATANFASLQGGMTPDYIIPANFFPTGGGTLNYAGIDVWNYGAVPTDGVQSLHKDTSNVVTTGVNTPHNFAGLSGTVNAATTAVSATSTVGIVLTLGALLLVASGLLRRRQPTLA